MGGIETIGFSTVAFAATNVDDFFLLLAYFADGRSRTRQVVLGQYLGFAAIILLSVLAAWGASFLPQNWVHLVGIVPLILGIKELIELRKPADVENQQRELNTTVVANQNIMAIAGVTIANGADNVSAYVPMFALQQENDSLIIFTFYVLLAVWCIVAYRLAKVGRAFFQGRALSFLKPIVLVLMGGWMVFKFATSN